MYLNSRDSNTASVMIPALELGKVSFEEVKFWSSASAMLNLSVSERVYDLMTLGLQDVRI